jgi:hypothetical protein
MGTAEDKTQGMGPKGNNDPSGRCARRARGRSDSGSTVSCQDLTTFVGPGGFGAQSLHLSTVTTFMGLWYLQ